MEQDLVKRRALTHTPFEKGNLSETTATQNHRANDLLPRRSTLAGLPKVRKPSKLSKGGPIMQPQLQKDPLFILTKTP